MRCPVCARDEKQIVATRESDESDVTRRYLKCEKRFNTATSVSPAVRHLSEA
jgi:transcriptional repressor NrdR